MGEIQKTTGMNWRTYTPDMLHQGADSLEQVILRKTDAGSVSLNLYRYSKSIVGGAGSAQLEIYIDGDMSPVNPITLLISCYSYPSNVPLEIIEREAQNILSSIVPDLRV